MQPALALLEVRSIARGIATGDAMAKRAPLATLHAGTVHPGKFVVLVGGEVASVEEAVAAGVDAAGDDLLDRVLLPGVHADVVEALRGRRDASVAAALGIVETCTVAAALHAADAGAKAAEARLLEIHLADGLGGKAYALFAGEVADVEAAIETAARAAGDELVAQVVIPRLHEEMRACLETAPRFRALVRDPDHDPAGGRS